MQMGKDKCAYINIEKGKMVSLGNTLKMHETEMTELTQGENYTYLGRDEDAGYNDSFNKERVASEYFKRYGNLNYTATIKSTHTMPLLSP